MVQWYQVLHQDLRAMVQSWLSANENIVSSNGKHHYKDYRIACSKLLGCKPAFY